MSERDAYYLQQCIALAVESAVGGGGPFGAMVVHEGEVIARCANGVTLRSDPTAHAEVEAIRQASRALGNPHLTDCVLYASCEPCPMCLAAALWAHIPRIVYAAPYAEAERAGFADSVIASSLYGQPRPRALPPGLLMHCALGEAVEPFDAWLANPDRVEY